MSIHYHASVFTAECLAISRALDLARNHPDMAFTIFTDSLSCILAIQNPVNCQTHSYAREISNKINSFGGVSLPHKPRLVWIPSHNGLTGNEEADKLAKRATEVAHHPYWKLPPQDMLRSTQVKCGNLQMMPGRISLNQVLRTRLA
ncbi:ribonuclease H1-like [Osmia lignaria lignaria]|uniref:ribonuclease H1-like n=1 Tax=Osmia lignaria lignaria TaxID=1437193 RepID=UPI00402B0F68